MTYNLVDWLVAAGHNNVGTTIIPDEEGLHVYHRHGPVVHIDFAGVGFFYVTLTNSRGSRMSMANPETLKNALGES